jgi:hypothetical protein
VAVATVISAIAFTALQVSSAASSIYARMLGFLQWLPAAGLALIGGQRPPSVPLPEHVSDPGDLIALPACLLAIWIVRRIDRRQVTAEWANRGDPLRVTTMPQAWRAGRESNPQPSDP